MVNRDPHCTPRISRRSPPDPPGRGRSRGSPSPPSSPNRRTRRAPRRPAQIQTVVPAGRKVDRERSAGAPGDCPGGLRTSLGKNVLFKGGLRPPCRAGAGGGILGRGRAAWRRPYSADATTRLHDRRAGPGDGDRSRWLDRPHRQSWLSWNAFIDRHGRPGRPNGARSRWRVSPTSELGPWRPCESVPGVLPAPLRASRPTPSPPAGRGARRPRAPRPEPRSGRRCPALAPRARATAVTTRKASPCLDSKGSAGGRQSSNLRGEATDDGSQPSARSDGGGLVD